MPLSGIDCSPLFRVISTQLARFSRSPTLPSNRLAPITCPVNPARRFKARNRPRSRHPPTTTCRPPFRGLGVLDFSSWLEQYLASRGVDPDNWLQAVDQFDTWFGRIVGSSERLRELLERTGNRWIRGMRNCRATFG
jgi:hypothetical protein